MYDENNPTGNDTLTAQAFNGCDSIIQVDLSFLLTSIGTYTYYGCQGDGFSITANGIIYNESNPTGIDTIVLGAFNGCDSIISINLIYGSNYIDTIDAILCPDEVLDISGSIISVPGEYIFNLTSISNCDSTLIYLIAGWNRRTNLFRRL